MIKLQFKLPQTLISRGFNTLQPSLSKETLTTWKSIVKTSTNIEYTTEDDDHSNLIEWRQYLHSDF